MAITASCLVFFPHILTSRQATLHAAHDSVHHIAGSYQARTRSGPAEEGSNRRRTIPGLHGNRVVCPMPLGRARDP